MEIKNSMLPESDKGVLVVLSGGMDSTVAMRLCLEKYGAEKVMAVTFDYKQKQRTEINKAKESTKLLGIEHKILDVSFLYEVSKGFSANVDEEIEMPDAKDIPAGSQPPTYVPNRNMILLSISAALAETKGLEYIITGLQLTDHYGYWDTSKFFVERMNDVLFLNGSVDIKIIAPFVTLSKWEEILMIKELDGDVELLKHTLTCYNPVGELSCGVCPSCGERLDAFKKAGEIDPIEYLPAE